MMEFRYSNLLTVLGVTFLYSSGMPILYPIAALYFFVTYWVDKWLLLRFYRKPVMFDSYMARETLKWFKWILVVHVLAGLLMYSNSSILPSDQVLMDQSNELVEDYVYTEDV